MTLLNEVALEGVMFLPVASEPVERIAKRKPSCAKVQERNVQLYDLESRRGDHLSLSGGPLRESPSPICGNDSPDGGLDTAR